MGRRRMGARLRVQESGLASMRQTRTIRVRVMSRLSLLRAVLRRFPAIWTLCPDLDSAWSCGTVSGFPTMMKGRSRESR